MPPEPLDEVDRGILHLLQEDARHLTRVDMAERLGVSDGTVRNRIQRMEENGVIEGYVPTLNYAAAGFPLQIVFGCSVPVTERAEKAARALELRGVVDIREMMTPSENIRVVVAATHTDDISRTAMALEELGLELDSEELMRHQYVRPFNHFGVEAVGAE